ncbi:CGH_1_HP_G0099480.mRNA.1.CDS.1 [Saccharomyces cerevisiae]|nr:CGH_1_HP_G0099480.mRNA.1.CDS.1 [Saccharomyces cerevisiae]CAI6946278.1 CGH_1_HP_G0099480.mRNA.1.CDS.1 [Saccharomyces cerevisiae]
MNRGDRRPKELKFTDFITSQLFNDIESICNLKVSTLKQHSKHALSEDSISHTGNGNSSSPSSAPLTPVTSSSKSSLFLPSGSSSTSRNLQTRLFINGLGLLLYSTNETLM